MNSIRIGGVIHKLKNDVPDKGHGIIVGDDGHHHLFMPSNLRPGGVTFFDLQIGMRVKFYPLRTKRGMRATGVSVIVSASVNGHAS